VDKQFEEFYILLFFAKQQKILNFHWKLSRISRKWGGCGSIWDNWVQGEGIMGRTGTPIKIAILQN
jgi:hypothetical protein